jgi:hypothetical protein
MYAAAATYSLFPLLDPALSVIFLTILLLAVCTLFTIFTTLLFLVPAIRQTT